MAQTSNEVEEIRDIATCPICLELFENAFILSCTHSFCMNCIRGLTEDATAYTRCPQCRQLSVPPPANVDQLQVHTFLNNLADLVREIDDGIVEQEESDESDTELFAGEYIEPTQTVRKSKSSKMAIAMLKGVATLASLGFGGIYFSRQAARKRKKKQQETAQDPTLCFTCDNCHNVQRYDDSELRYICGMCEKFNLCHACASDSLARVHRPDHILIKLKFRQRRRVPPGCLLKYKKARNMAEEIDFNSTIHTRAYYHTPEQIKWIDAVTCSFCADSPISGTRYKCGMCKDYDLCAQCEVHSHEIHDRDHIFLVFKNRAKVNVISEPLMKALLY